MRIAYFSPINPQKSGISAYSESLLLNLKKYCEIDLWVDGTHPSNPDLSPYQIFDYAKNPKMRSLLKNYDLLIYNIGNNPHFHAEMYDVFLEYPGIVILHDYVLYFLITGYYLHHEKDEIMYIKEFYFNYGRVGIDAVKQLLRSNLPLLQYSHPEKYPLVKRILTKAVGIIVHSDTTRELILKQGYPPERVVHINHINFMSKDLVVSDSEVLALREKYGFSQEDILIASFGYIAPTKRNLPVIEVLNQFSTTVNYPVKYLMVGEGGYVNGYLSDRIRKTGYINIHEFEPLLHIADIIINLRCPSMGETSGTLLRAMSAGKPCIVSDIGWFSELPDDVVLKISCDRVKEKEELAKALVTLLDNDGKREELGRKAREYALTCYDPDKIAREMKCFFDWCHDHTNTVIHYPF